MHKKIAIWLLGISALLIVVGFVIGIATDLHFHRTTGNWVSAVTIIGGASLALIVTDIMLFRPRS